MAEPGDAEIEVLRAAIEHVSVGRRAVARADDQLDGAYRDLMSAVIPVAEKVSADDVRAAFADQIDDVDRAILHGLAQGVPRSSLHTRLGIKRREVDERIPRLHKLAGTETLFQLGRAASALGWLTAAS